MSTETSVFTLTSLQLPPDTLTRCAAPGRWTPLGAQPWPSASPQCLLFPPKPRESV